MVTQIVTLAGVLVGALTSYLATAMAERGRFQRTMATRWDERKLEAYIEYLSCIKEELRAARSVFEAVDAGEDHTEPFARMNDVEARRSILFEGLVLLGDAGVADAANVVNQTTWELWRLAKEPVGREAGASSAAGMKVVEALNALHEAARIDLEIGRGRRPTARR